MVIGSIILFQDTSSFLWGLFFTLLSIAKKQDRVVLDDTGLSIALGIKDGLAKPFAKKSINLSDGKNGDEGGVGILRSKDLELVFKYASQGSSHGHYDKLSFSLLVIRTVSIFYKFGNMERMYSQKFGILTIGLPCI